MSFFMHACSWCQGQVVDMSLHSPGTCRLSLYILLQYSQDSSQVHSWPRTQPSVP
jgi:hypothetical protein